MAVQRTNEKQNPQIWLPVTAEDVARKRRTLIYKLSGLALIVILGVWFIYQRSMNPQDARQAYQAGIPLYRSGQYEQAILNFNRAISLNSGYAEAYRMRAKTFSDNGNTAAAIADLTKVMELAPRDSEALTDRALLYLSKKDYPRVIADATKALSVDSKLARAYNLRGTAIRAMGDPRKALDDFSKAVEFDPNLDDYFQRASTYQLLDDHQHAVEDFTQAIVIAPEQPHAYFARAKSKAALGDKAGARADFMAARKLDGW